MDIDQQDAWKDQSLAALKQELAKLQEVSKTLQDAKCDGAYAEVNAKIEALKLHTQSRMPQGQRLQVLESQLRKSVQQRQKLDNQIAEAQARLNELTSKQHPSEAA